MKYLNCTLGTVAENLALDEALLETVDSVDRSAGEGASELLRLWQAESVFVVLGRSSKVAEEVDLSVADSLPVPIYRRISGGTTIVAAPGCAFYSLLIDLERRPHLRMLDAAHEFVMSGLCASLRPLQPQIAWTGTCDLVIGNLKVGGNSLRIGRRWMLYHGTLLLDMNLHWIGRLLRYPPREPEYRAGRSHLEFVTNLGVDMANVETKLREYWQAVEPLEGLPEGLIQRLVDERYSKSEWNRQR